MAHALQLRQVDPWRRRRRPRDRPTAVNRTMTQNDNRGLPPTPAGVHNVRHVPVVLLIGAILVLIVIASLTLH